MRYILRVLIQGEGVNKGGVEIKYKKKKTRELHIHLNMQQYITKRKQK